MTSLTKRIFVGSSDDARYQAGQLIKGCTTSGIIFVPWWTSFPASRTILGQLASIRNQVDGAVLLLTPDLPTEVRGRQEQLPNQNVLFEFGFFYGAFDPSHVAAVRYGDAYMTGNLGGYLHIFGAKNFIPKGGNPTSGRTKREFDQWVDNWV